MATTLQLERIAALVEKLGPLADKQRGMRIEADEWNVLVDVLRGILQIDRGQEDSARAGLEKNFAAIDHEHLGQVSMAWLDAELQSRLGGTTASGSVATRTALSETTQKIGSLGTEVARLRTLAETQQTALDRGSVDAADRSKVLQQFETRFAGLENLRTLVSTVGNEVAGVRNNVDTVLKLRESLSDAAGNAINVAQLQTELGDLQTLRENLKGVDGNLLRLRDIEVRLNEIGDATGAGGAGGLDQRINLAIEPVRAELLTGQNQHDAAIRESLAADLGSSETRLRAELKTDLDTRDQAIDASLGSRIAAAELRIGSALDQDIALSAAAVTKAANDNASTLIEQRLAGLPDQVRATATELIGTVRVELENQISKNLGAALDTRFGALQQGLDTRLKSIEVRVDDFETRLPGLVAGSVDALRGEFSELLSEQIKTRVESLRADLNSSITEQIRTGIAATRSGLDARVDSAIDARLSGLDTIVASSVANATRDLPDQISSEVTAQIDAMNVDQRISTANAGLATQLRTEQAQALADQQARNSTALSNSVSLLRGEINATRTELTTAINTRTATTGSTVTTVTRPVG